MKKAKMVRKIEGVKVTGFYGRSYWCKGLRGDNGHRSHRRHRERGGVGEQPLTIERVKDYKRLEYMLSRAYCGYISPSADLETDKVVAMESLPIFF